MPERRHTAVRAAPYAPAVQRQAARRKIDAVAVHVRGLHAVADAATVEAGALGGKGRARCADPEPDRYSRCFVLPVKGVPMIGGSNDQGAGVQDVSLGSDSMKNSDIAGRVA